MTQLCPRDLAILHKLPLLGPTNIAAYGAMHFNTAGCINTIKVMEVKIQYNQLYIYIYIYKLINRDNSTTILRAYGK